MTQNIHVDIGSNSKHLLMPTLARRPNNKKKPNNIEGNKEEELAK